jgi:hypothetical protein
MKKFKIPKVYLTRINLQRVKVEMEVAVWSLEVEDMWGSPIRRRSTREIGKIQTPFAQNYEEREFTSGANL